MRPGVHSTLIPDGFLAPVLDVSVCDPRRLLWCTARTPERMMTMTTPTWCDPAHLPACCEAECATCNGTADTVCC